MKLRLIAPLSFVAVLFASSFSFAETDWCYQYEQQGNHDAAIAECTKAIELNPKNDSAYNSRGLAYEAKGRFDQAIADYNRVIKLRPKFDYAYYNRGNAYRAKGRLHQAIADYTRAIELNPKNDFAYNNRGIAYRAMGRFDQAIADYNKTIELNPKNVEAYYNMACLYARRKMVTQSCQWLKKATVNGFNGWEYMKQDPALDNIRTAACYKQIMQGK